MSNYKPGSFYRRHFVSSPEPTIHIAEASTKQLLQHRTKVEQIFDCITSSNRAGWDSFQAELVSKVGLEKVEAGAQFQPRDSYRHQGFLDGILAIPDIDTDICNKCHREAPVVRIIDNAVTGPQSTDYLACCPMCNLTRKLRSHQQRLRPLGTYLRLP